MIFCITFTFAFNGLCVLRITDALSYKKDFFPKNRSRTPPGLFLNARHLGLGSSPVRPFVKKQEPHPVGRGSRFLWWAIQDLNPGPSGYEPPALTS